MVPRGRRADGGGGAEGRGPQSAGRGGAPPPVRLSTEAGAYLRLNEEGCLEAGQKKGGETNAAPAEKKENAWAAGWLQQAAAVRVPLDELRLFECVAP